MLLQNFSPFAKQIANINSLYRIYQDDAAIADFSRCVVLKLDFAYLVNVFEYSGW